MVERKDERRGGQSWFGGRGRLEMLCREAVSMFGESIAVVNLKRQKIFGEMDLAL
jgi:hypothetical protein